MRVHNNLFFFLVGESIFTSGVAALFLESQFRENSSNMKEFSSSTLVFGRPDKLLGFELLCGLNPTLIFDIAPSRPET